MLKQYSASMEDYLEAIANLYRDEKVVKVRQLSRTLNVKMPSVTAALERLSEEGLVIHKQYGDIKLTPEGDRAAQDVIRRHRALSRFFTEGLDINKEIAEEDACKIEHVISSITLERIIKFIKFIEACPLGADNFPKRYRHYLEHGEFPPECLERGLGER